MRHLLAGFLGGEIDPMMKGRVDSDNYAYGLDNCENFIALSLGPLVKRQGWEYIRDADASAAWLSAFRFSVTQEYVIEWDEAKARFFTNGGRIETAPNVPYELAVPYAAAAAPALSTQQSYDRLYIDHPGYPPAAIARTSAVTFSYAALDLRNGPFKDDNTDEAVTLTVSAASGSGIAITASSAIFLAGHVGALMRIQAKDFSDIPVWEPGMAAVTIGQRVRSDGKAYEALTAGNTGSVQPTHTEGAAWDGLQKQDVLNTKGPYGVQWQYVHDKFGIVKITAVGSGTGATADVVRRLPDSCVTVPTRRWAHSCFSTAEGWPSQVALMWGRQVHLKDFDLIASVAGDYGGGQVNFAAFTDSGTLAADLAFRRTLATEDPPIWVVADRRLLLGTASKELAIGPVNAQAAVSGENILAEPQSFYGSEPVRPVQIGIETVFVERGGRRIRAASYEFTRDRYTADDITVAARHITSSGIRQLAYQRVPWPMLLALREDGQIVCHSDTKLDVKGFSRMRLGGAAVARSIVSIVGADGKSDEAWLLVERSTPGGPRREIWRQTSWRELGSPQAECFYVDAGVRIDAAGGQTTFNGLAHLAGQAVAVLAGGAVIEGMTVSGGGTLTLPAEAVPASAYVLIVGLAYTATATTLPPEFKTPGGTIQGLKKRVRKMVLRLLETLGVQVGQAHADPARDRLDDLPDLDRIANAPMDAPTPLFSGDTQGLVETEPDRNGQVTFTSSVPLPATITAAMLTLEVDQKDA